MIIVRLKYCPDCGEKRPASEFYVDRRRRTGLQTYCKAHINSRRDKKKVAAYYRRHRVESEEYCEAQRACCRANYWKDREKHLARMTAWREANPGAAYAANKAWRAKNPGAAVIQNEARRAREKGAEGSFTVEEWHQLCATHFFRCAYCLERRKLTVHHVVALARGGSNWISNILPACRSCNSKIGIKFILPGDLKL